jgi:hypothetical protein
MFTPIPSNLIRCPHPSLLEPLLDSRPGDPGGSQPQLDTAV